MRLQPNRDFALLRYLPGGALGLRELSENFGDIMRVSWSGAATEAPVASLDDLALMLLIAESADDVRNWVEQSCRRPLPRASWSLPASAPSRWRARMSRARIESAGCSQALATP